MRTTLDIDDDVLQAAKELATRYGTTASRVISCLARRGLSMPEAPPQGKEVVRGGVPVLPSRGEIITAEEIQTLMDEEGV